MTNEVKVQALSNPVEALALNEKEEALLASFIETASLNGHDDDVVTNYKNPSCGVFLKDGRDIPCLALYEDELGGWVCLCKADGMVRQYTADEVL